MSAYCRTGGGGHLNEPCQTVSYYDGAATATTVGEYHAYYNASNVAVNTPDINRPELWPGRSGAAGDDGNFMIINGSYDPSKPLPPSRLWCQTIFPTGDAAPRYYVFSVWVQNMISAGRNLDVPQVRMTVCDMQDPATGLLPADGSGVPAGDGSPSRLPGITDVRAGVMTALGRVYHNPVPPVNRLKSFLVDFSYGAASRCNASGEANDYRLKVLGSDFLINEAPDNWVLLRCIYRKPGNVKEMNICVENLSITKNGNDIGIDNIQFQECTGASSETLDKLLKGDPCELSDVPEALQYNLRANILDFSGKLIGNKVYLDWLTIAEDNMVAYEVQRSIDGEHFSKIGSVDAKNSKGGMNNYNFTDSRLPYGVKYLYYRLNMISSNVKGELGPVIAVPIDALDNFDVKLIPNPTLSGNEVEVQFNVPKGKANIKITNLMGMQMMSDLVDTKDGDNSLYINTSGLAPGIYIITITQGGKRSSRKLVIQ